MVRPVGSLQHRGPTRRWRGGQGSHDLRHPSRRIRRSDVQEVGHTRTKQECPISTPAPRKASRSRGGRSSHAVDRPA
jgi:hypothetical protein